MDSPESNTSNHPGETNLASRWKQPEIIFAIWSILALASLYPVTKYLDGAFPIFTVIWILVPLIAVAWTRDASKVGFRKISLREFIRVAAINISVLFLITLLVEPWSHTYQMLLEAALSSQPPDTTFAWFLRLPNVPALGAMLLYGGLVTLFAEELFFRGWLLQLFKRRWGATWSIAIQALLFTVPNLLATFVLPPLQSVLYVFVYSFLAVGVIGGWAASRTNSIWPSLFSVTVSNFLFVVLMV